MNVLSFRRILRPVDGSPVFLSDAEFRYNQEMWDQLRKIMDIVGFSQEVHYYFSHLTLFVLVLQSPRQIFNEVTKITLYL